MIKELLVSTALLCSASLSFSYCMGEARIVVEGKRVKCPFVDSRNDRLNDSQSKDFLKF